ncbi:MAG: hypothetical protein O3A37_10975 [Planctomycetota bacterium]|jgi:hypothetical protein|nr:hypothetical protein [Planctomycetota bacterium]
MRPRVDVSNRHIGPRLLYARGAIHGPRGLADLRSERGVASSDAVKGGATEAHLW